MGREIVTLAEDLKEQLRKTCAQREAVERQLAVHTEALPAFDGPLVDAQGFPRADVDLHRVRHHRQRILRLKNDHKHLEDQLAALLGQLHETSSSIKRPEPLAPLPSGQSSATTRHFDEGPKALQPFAVVDEVSADSPAGAAGLQVGDRLTSFAEVTSSTNSPVAAVAQCLQAHLGEFVRVQLLRHGSPLSLQVRPQAWAGRGLLGARLRPA